MNDAALMEGGSVIIGEQNIVQDGRWIDLHSRSVDNGGF
jgi:hypothetical protein